MNSVFISYSSKDSDIADKLHSQVSNLGLKAFLAEISIDAGSKWTEVIFDNLRSADYFFFIATKDSISSSAVQQELGAALVQEKEIIPVLHGVSVDELPGWISNYQAIDPNSSPDKLQGTIEKIARKVKNNKWVGLAMIAGIIYMALKSK